MNFFGKDQSIAEKLITVVKISKFGCTQRFEIGHKLTRKLGCAVKHSFFNSLQKKTMINSKEHVVVCDL